MKNACENGKRYVNESIHIYGIKVFNHFAVILNFRKIINFIIRKISWDHNFNFADF